MNAVSIRAEDQWRAVLERDAAYDGQLFYAVSTTGVYCRPSCPSKRPSPANVRFFASPDDAERAGFRPCKRCHPHKVSAPVELVQRVTAWIDAHPQERSTLARLSAALNVSPFHLQRTFKHATGLTPAAFAEARRQKRFETALNRTERVTDAVYDAGFSSSSRAYEREMGMSPGQRARKGAGLAIRYITTRTEFGEMLVAATDRGVCAVRLGDDPEQMAAEFGQDFAQAKITRDPSLTDVIDQILVLISRDQPHPQIPLDVRATAFQKRVWDYLQSIPRSQTRTYSQVARDLGQPTATRAVARACATNPVALVVPCHRVISVDGKLTGYRWGIDRKRRLLEREA